MSIADQILILAVISAGLLFLSGRRASKKLSDDTCIACGKDALFFEYNERTGTCLLSTCLNCGEQDKWLLVGDRYVRAAK